MWEQIVKTMEEMQKQTRYVVYHNPSQPMPQPDFSLLGVLRFRPHDSVPVGQVWVMHDQPSGRIVTEE
jgi:hypothetical protein